MVGKFSVGCNSWGPILSCKYDGLNKKVDFYHLQAGEENPQKLAEQVKQMFKPIWKTSSYYPNYDITGKLDGKYDRMVLGDFIVDDNPIHERFKMTDTMYKFIDYIKELGQMSESDRRKALYKNRGVKKIEEILN